MFYMHREATQSHVPHTTKEKRQTAELEAEHKEIKLSMHIPKLWAIAEQVLVSKQQDTQISKDGSVALGLLMVSKDNVQKSAKEEMLPQPFMLRAVLEINGNSPKGKYRNRNMDFLRGKF